MKNIFICPDNYIESILVKFRLKGYITYEKSSGLDQIGIHTNFKDEDEIYKKILGGI
ncbi:unnamed protein product [marine sediment metagenome]|uniref:Uncharacterized protein n=1 Tax=marine sediment metagenome TaxID=412755 RepID=X1IEL7_9ZZZZ